MRVRGFRGAFIAIMAIILGGCSESADPPGVLVTYRPASDAGFDNAGIGTGTLEVLGSCIGVRLPNGAEFTLLWSDDTVRWDGTDIVFLHPADGEQRLSLGEAVTPGGSEVEDGSSPNYVSRPNPDCPRALFAVGDI